MAQRIINKTYETSQRIIALRRDKLGLILLSLILASLAVYIYGLNLAVGEGFQKARLEKDTKILRQDLQSLEESFAAELAAFYENGAASFAGAEMARAQFVSRQANIARAGSGFTQ